MKYRMQRDLFLAVDIGTTNVKGAVFQKENGDILDSISSKIPLHTDAERGVAEQNPLEIYKAVESLASYFAKKYGGKSISAIFLTSQMHAFGILDLTHKPKTNLLTYFDTRSRAFLGEIEEKGYELYLRTGCPPLHVYPLSKILLARRSGWLERRDRLLVSAKDYVLLRMTGHHVLDLSTASGSQLLSINGLTWDDLALEIAGVEESQLPQLVEGSEKPLPLDSEFANNTGLSPDVEVYAGVSDASANQLGVGGSDSRRLAINLGTSAAVRFMVDHPVLDDPRMRFFLYYAGRKKYLAGGAVNNGGVILEWFLRSLGKAELEFSRSTGEDVYSILDSMASSSTPGANGIIALPFLLGGERFPIRRPDAKALFYGVQFHHTKKDLLRSLLEGVAFTLRMIYDALCEKGLKAESVSIGGSGSGMRTWRQIIADVFGLSVYRPRTVESALLGAMLHYAETHSIKLELPVLEVANLPNSSNMQAYQEAYKTFTQLVNLFYCNTRVD